MSMEKFIPPLTHRSLAEGGGTGVESGPSTQCPLKKILYPEGFFWASPGSGISSTHSLCSCSLYPLPPFPFLQVEGALGQVSRRNVGNTFLFFSQLHPCTDFPLTPFPKRDTQRLGPWNRDKFLGTAVIVGPMDLTLLCHSSHQLRKVPGGTLGDPSLPGNGGLLGTLPDCASHVIVAGAHWHRRSNAKVVWQEGGGGGAILAAGSALTLKCSRLLPCTPQSLVCRFAQERCVALYNCAPHTHTHTPQVA